MDPPLPQLLPPHPPLLPPPPLQWLLASPPPQEGEPVQGGVEEGGDGGWQPQGASPEPHQTRHHLQDEGR